jgi:hypothetical protein
MRWETVLEQWAITVYQTWVWVDYKTGGHPFLALGALITVIMVWALYKTNK